jgi:hypothetical protein
MTSISKGAFLVVTASLVALLVGSIFGIGGVHMTFAANKGINVQTDTNQDQGFEAAGGTSGTTNACTATSTPGSMQTSVTLQFRVCFSLVGGPISCAQAINCNDIGCTSVSCNFSFGDRPGNCTTDNGVQLTSCTFASGNFITWYTRCTRYWHY